MTLKPTSHGRSDTLSQNPNRMLGHVPKTPKERYVK